MPRTEHGREITGEMQRPPHKGGFQTKMAGQMAGYVENRHSLATRTFVRRVESTPDPDTLEKYRDTPPTSIAILLQKHALFLAESSIYTIRLPFVSRYFCRSIRVRGRWNTPEFASHFPANSRTPLWALPKAIFRRFFGSGPVSHSRY